MPELCATAGGDTVCMPLDLTVFDDPRQGEVPEAPGDAPGAIATTGTPLLRTRVPWGAVPDAWPRGERIDAELVKGQERVPCELLVQAADDDADRGPVELVLLGEEVFRAVLGRAP